MQYNESLINKKVTAKQTLVKQINCKQTVHSAFGVQRGVLQNTPAEMCLLMILPLYGLAVSEIIY